MMIKTLLYLSMDSISEAVIHHGDQRMIAEAMAKHVDLLRGLLVDPESFRWDRRGGIETVGAYIEVIGEVEPPVEPEEPQPVRTFRLGFDRGDTIVEGSPDEVLAKIDKRRTRAIARAKRMFLELEEEESAVLYSAKGEWTNVLTRIT